MVKDHSDRERGNPLPSRGLLFLISQSFSTGWNNKYFIVRTTRDRSDDLIHHERTLYHEIKTIIFKNTLNVQSQHSPGIGLFSLTKLIYTYY